MCLWKMSSSVSSFCRIWTEFLTSTITPDCFQIWKLTIVSFFLVIKFVVLEHWIRELVTIKFCFLGLSLVIMALLFSCMQAYSHVYVLCKVIVFCIHRNWQVWSNTSHCSLKVLDMSKLLVAVMALSLPYILLKPESNYFYNNATGVK